MPKKLLSPEVVNNIFFACLININEGNGQNVKEVAGVMTTVKFDIQRLKEYEKEIHQMLNELPTEFRHSHIGASLRKSFEDKHGNRWAEQLQTVDQLFQLGLAAGSIKLLVPKTAWDIFPEGLPYFSVHE